MAFEVITIVAGGVEFRPVTFAMTLSLEETPRSFEAKIKHRDYPQAALLALLKSSPECTIRALRWDGVTDTRMTSGGDLILKGFVEKRSPRLGGDEKELPIAGRGKLADAIDSAAEHETGEFKNKKAPDVFGDLLKPFGLTVESDVTHNPRTMFRLRPGETVFRAMERWARAEGFAITDTPEGNAKLQKGAKKKHAGEIRDGDSVWPRLIDASAAHDDSKRFSKIKVRAQAPDGYAPDQLQIEDEASDDSVKRHRPRIIVPPELTLKKDARERAKWHRDRAAGNGLTAEVSVKGWRDAGGTLWTPGWLVPVQIADLGLAQDMLIKTVALEQSDADGGGTVARLSLVDPRAFGGKSPKGGKSGGNWNMGKSGSDDE